MSIESIVNGAQISVIASCENDVDAYESFSECMSEAEIKELLEKTENNVWRWCSVQVTISYNGIEFSDYLGGCSYESEEDFKEGGYYDDMVDQVKLDLTNNLQELKNELNN